MSCKVTWIKVIRNSEDCFPISFDYYITLLYYILQYFTIFYYMLLYFTIFYYILLYFTIFYYSLLYFTIFYYILLYYYIIALTISTTINQCWVPSRIWDINWLPKMKPCLGCCSQRSCAASCSEPTLAIDPPSKTPTAFCSKGVGPRKGSIL